jgi:hypothetical protein
MDNEDFLNIYNLLKNMNDVQVMYSLFFKYRNCINKIFDYKCVQKRIK